MHVLIIGAGIGGPVAATALARAGIETSLYEAHDGPGIGIGAFLGLAPNGLDALRTLGLLDAVRASPGAHVAHRTEFLDGAGRLLGVLSDGSEMLGPELHSLGVRRGELQATLAEASGAGIHYGKRLVDCTDTGDSVIARFADGSTAEGDVLIGADGLHSRVRAQLIPHAPRYAGMMGIGGWTSGLSIATPPPLTGRMVFGRRAFFLYDVAPDGDVYWGVNFPHQELSRKEITARGTTAWRQYLTQLFDGEFADLTTILRGSDDSWFLPYGLYDLADLPQWSRGRIGLIGDAAHAVPNSSGQGASMAIEDGIVLAQCLRDIRDPAAALRLMEKLRRDRVARIITAGRRRGGAKTITNPLAVALRNLAIRVVLARIAKKSGHSWIYDYRIEFDKPVNQSAQAARS